jgi:hypothetical protein
MTYLPFIDASPFFTFQTTVAHCCTAGALLHCGISARVMSEMGLGRVKTKTRPARTEHFSGIAHQESQMMLRT